MSTPDAEASEQSKFMDQSEVEKAHEKGGDSSGGCVMGSLVNDAASEKKAKLRALLALKKQAREEGRVAAEKEEDMCREVVASVAAAQYTRSVMPNIWSRPLFMDSKIRGSADDILQVVYTAYGWKVDRELDGRVRPIAEDFAQGLMTPAEMFDSVDRVMNGGEREMPRKMSANLKVMATQLGENYGEVVTIAELDDEAQQNSSKCGVLIVSKETELTPGTFVYAGSVRHFAKLKKNGYAKIATRRKEVAELCSYVEHYWSKWFWCNVDKEEGPPLPVGTLGSVSNWAALCAPMGAFIEAGRENVIKMSQPKLMERYVHALLSSNPIIETQGYRSEGLQPYTAVIERYTRDDTRIRYRLSDVAREMWPALTELDGRKVGRLNVVHSMIRALAEKLVYHSGTAQFINPEAVLLFSKGPSKMAARVREQIAIRGSLVESFLVADQARRARKPKHADDDDRCRCQDCFLSRLTETNMP